MATVVLCILLAAAFGAPQAWADAPWHVAYDLRMDETAPPLMLSAQNQTQIGVLMRILQDPHGAGERLWAACMQTLSLAQRSDCRPVSLRSQLLTC